MHGSSLLLLLQFDDYQLEILSLLAGAAYTAIQRPLPPPPPALSIRSFGGKLQLQLAQVVRARKTIFPSPVFDRDRPHHAITIKSGFAKNLIMEKIENTFFSFFFVIMQAISYTRLFVQIEQQ